MKRQTTSPPFGIRDKLGYLLGDFGNDFTFIFASSYLMVFYTKVLGLSGTAVGTLFLAARLVDAVTDVTMGRIVDSVRPAKDGRFRPWIRRMCIPVAAASTLMYLYGVADWPYPDPDAPGYMQGEQVAELLGSDEAFRKYDLNGDGKIQYAMFRAEVGNAEADGRTRYSVEQANKLLAKNDALTAADKDGNVLVRVGADQPANWDSATANNMMGSLFRVQNGVPNIELVLCNNDDMALGVISALEAKGYNKQGSRDKDGAYIPVFGVDALATATDAIKNGKMQGTVKQDGDAMAKAIVQIAANIMEGKEFLAGTEHQFEEGVRKLRIAYSPVNAQ